MIIIFINYYSLLTLQLLIFHNHSPITTPLQKEEVVSYIDESVTLHVLNRWLSATNIDEMRAQSTIQKLCLFVRNAFIIIYASRNIERVKSLDAMTKGIAVPSRNGNNYASNLKF